MGELIDKEFITLHIIVEEKTPLKEMRKSSTNFISWSSWREIFTMMTSKK